MCIFDATSKIKTMIKIEKNVPFPDGSGRQPKYPYDKMEIGDSFFLPSERSELTKLCNNINSSSFAASKRIMGNPKFVYRRTSNPIGVRVFRIK